MHWYLNFFEKFNQTLYLFSRSFAPDSRFSEFSTDCSKVLETIEKTTIIKPQSSTTNKIKKKIKKFPVKPKLNSGSDNDDNVDKDVVLGHEEGPNSSKKPSRVQKKRKASTSCAQQARNECYNTNSAEINLSIDYLADYLEETILFPKKMSYMAELMYTWNIMSKCTMYSKIVKWFTVGQKIWKSPGQKKTPKMKWINFTEFFVFFGYFPFYVYPAAWWLLFKLHIQSEEKTSVICIIKQMCS